MSARTPADPLAFPAEPLTPRHLSSPTTRKGCQDQPAPEAARECSNSEYARRTQPTTRRTTSVTHTPLLASRARRHEPRTGHRDSSLDSGETPARLSPNNSRSGPPARAPTDQLILPAEPPTPRHRSSPTTRKGCLDQPASEAARECLRTASDTTAAVTVHSQPRLGPRPVLLVFQKPRGAVGPGRRPKGLRLFRNQGDAKMRGPV